MALSTTKNTTITGTSSTADGQAIAFFTASVPSGDGSSNANQNINNQGLYDANKDTVRKDFNDFMTQVYAIEDEMDTSTK